MSESRSDGEVGATELTLRGSEELRAGRLEAAEALLSKAVQVDSGNLPALKLLASVYWRSQDMPRAEAVCRRLSELEPDNPHTLNSVALCRLFAGDPTEAASLLDRVVRLDSATAQFRHNLGLAYLALDRLSDAIDAFKEAVRLKPESIESLSQLGEALATAGSPIEAVEYFRRVSGVAGDTPAGRLSAARALLLGEGSLEEALILTRSAIEGDPRNVQAFTLEALLLQRMGRFEEASRSLERAIEINPDFAPPYLHLVEGKRITEQDGALVESMRRMVEQPGRPLDDLRTLHFALGKAHDDLGNYPRAMKHFGEGNRAARVLHRRWFDRTHYGAHIDHIIEAFTPRGENSGRSSGSNSERPIAIVGMFRSGTTLLEQILSSHPHVAAGGELTFWNEQAKRLAGPARFRLDASAAAEVAAEYLRLLEGYGPADRVTDKMPENYRWAGLIHSVFPNTRILFCRRNAVDTCLSNFMTLTAEPAPYANEASNLVYVYRQHLALLELWRETLPADRFMEVRYEDLVREQERTTRAVVEFCGLPWDDACLRPEDNRRMVRTASQWQVRQSVYTRSLERRSNYANCLGEFGELLALDPDDQ